MTIKYFAVRFDSNSGKHKRSVMLLPAEIDVQKSGENWEKSMGPKSN